MRIKAISRITPGDADDWRLNLLEQGLAADTTVRKRCGIAKQIFSSAVRRKLIAENPFADLKSAMLANPSRSYFVTQAEIQQVIDACPDAEWRLIVALSRYGGLRCPSEHLKLRWGDVDWEKGRIRVWSPKTEHHPGGESRIIPIFPELRPFLEEAFELASPGVEFVITRYRDPSENFGIPLARIVRRAGLTPWPKIFHNMRSSRQTELEDQFPSHVVCMWIGNSQPVAKKHYLQVTDDHFEKALRNAQQQGAVWGRNDSQADLTAHKKPLQLQGFAGECDSARTPPMDDTGLEPVTSTMSTWRSSQLS